MDSARMLEARIDSVFREWTTAIERQIAEAEATGVTGRKLDRLRTTLYAGMAREAERVIRHAERTFENVVIKRKKRLRGERSLKVIKGK